MSQINFDTFRRKYPKLTGAWRELERWFLKNSKKGFIEIAILRKGIPTNISDDCILLAIQYLVDDGELHSALRLRAPDGTILEGEYASPSDFPDSVWDRLYQHQFQLKELQVVSGFSLEAHGAPA